MTEQRASVVALAIVCCLVLSGCSNSALRPLGSGAADYLANAEEAPIPLHLYLPRSEDIEDRTWMEDESFTRFCGLGFDDFDGVSRSGRWLQLPEDGRGDDTYIDDTFSFSVAHFDDAESEFDRRVKLLRDCDEISDAEHFDEMTGAQPHFVETVEGLGDEAVAADSGFGRTSWISAGDVVLVRQGNLVIWGHRGLFNSTILEEWRELYEEFGETKVTAIPPSAPRQTAQNAVRAALDRADDRFPSGLEVVEVSSLFAVVRNTGDTTIVSSSVTSLANEGDGPSPGAVVPAHPIPPGGSAVLYRNPDERFTVMGIESDTSTYELEVLEPPTIGGEFSLRATGSFEVGTEFAPKPARAALVFRNADNEIIQSQWVRFDFDSQWDKYGWEPSEEESFPQSLLAEGQVEFVEGAVSVEVMRA